MSKKQRLLCVVMDGVGEREDGTGNAVHHAYTPCMDALRAKSLYRTLYSHGPYVGLPTENDMGNSEVGHNTLGAGRIVDQGAKLVHDAISSKRLYQGDTWRDLMMYVKTRQSTLHFLGLLSDGGVHSHENHLHSMLAQAAKEGIKYMRLHLLFDGRDVAPCSAEVYMQRLHAVIAQLSHADIRVASAGGRMHLTMDRYGADWQMVKRGWDHHVLARGETYSHIDQALETLRKLGHDNDQYLPGIVIADPHKRGGVRDGDGVVCFNFRPDRVIQISQAFSDPEFSGFEREYCPKVYYCGMCVYDADVNLPQNVLVSSSVIENPLTQYMLSCDLRQFACSETHKFGHVTFFWNGNRSGYFDAHKEEYLEIPSLSGEANEQPWMKCHDIAEATIKRLYENTFDFARINFAAGDMVGHTGDFQAAVIAVGVVDAMLSRLLQACKDTATTLLITADHGNCETMFFAGDVKKPRTSHSTEKVPLFIVPTNTSAKYHLQDVADGGLAHVANTILHLMNIPQCKDYYPSLLKSENI